MADEYQIAVWKNGRKNKGWAGLVLERYLGLAQNSRQAPDFGTWDLKLVALNYARDGSLRVKESMAITMLEPTEMLGSKFEDSHLYDKLRSLVAVGRIYESTEEKRSILHERPRPWRHFASLLRAAGFRRAHSEFAKAGANAQSV